MPLSEHTPPPKARSRSRPPARPDSVIVNRAEDHAAGDTRTLIGGIPEAWPALLTREQVCAYVGMSADSMARTCPVAPVALGVKLLRCAPEGHRRLDRGPAEPPAAARPWRFGRHRPDRSAAHQIGWRGASERRLGAR
ncbi:hypothetical protein [Caulobacter sp. UC70_42]|uniref:hypothetical protein n=1 Tax=Caulobacter sp. UC70_42 TaxID=3374551 RepID=UPI0037566677